MIVRSKLKQTFKNASNNWVEAIYVFPLPETATVDQLRMTIGERKIIAEIKDSYYQLLMLVPPIAKHNNNAVLAKKVSYIIDTSSSMYGASMEQAKSTLITALNKLQTSDKFNIIQFDSNTSQLFSNAHFASNENINIAKEYINSLNADGGTEIAPALKLALDQAGDNGQTLAFGPRHNFASALPGSRGNSLISAHRDTHFSFLQYLQIGDIIQIETAHAEKSLFKVASTKIVDMDSTRFVDDPSQASIHLVTCFPFDSMLTGGSQRYIVTAETQRSLER